MWSISYDMTMDSDTQKKIDDIMFETNAKISAIVDEIRNIRFSKMDEDEKNRISHRARALEKAKDFLLVLAEKT